MLIISDVVSSTYKKIFNFKINHSVLYFQQDCMNLAQINILTKTIKTHELIINST